MNPTQLDPQAVNLAKAIRQTESGNNPTAQGKSGEYGSYQFTEPTWNTYASKHGVNVPLKQATPEQQNEVAYKQIKEWKDQGMNIGQIASMWNSGKPDAYQDTSYSGTNKYGAKFDVPAYAKNVATAYQTLKNGGNVQVDPNNPSSVPDSNGYNPHPYSNPASGTNPFLVDTSGNAPEETAKPEGTGLIDQLENRSNDANTALHGIFNGSMNPLSGVLQTAGASAGAINDVVGSAIEHTPIIGSVVKGITGLIGKGVKKITDTKVGQTIGAGIKAYSEEHPELAKDISAVGNIASVIPVGKVAGVVGEQALKGAGEALAGTAQKSVIKELTEVAERTAGGRSELSNVGNKSIKILSQKEFIPDIENIGGKTRYATQDSYNKIGDAISKIEDEQLQPALAKVSTENVADRQPLESIREQALKDAKAAFKESGQVSKAESEINRVFDDYKNSYGDYVTLQDINDMKRGIRTSVNFSSPKLESDVTYHIGQTFQKNIEDQAEKLGLGDVHAINRSMGDLIKSQKFLKFIDGKEVKNGLIRRLFKEAAVTGASALGEGVGHATGIPIAGALGARSAGNLVSGILDKKTIGGVTGRFLK